MLTLRRGSKKGLNIGLSLPLKCGLLLRIGPTIWMSPWPDRLEAGSDWCFAALAATGW